MVNYSDIFEAFCRYAASRSQADWCDLWILCQRRMEALVKTKARNLAVPLDPGEIDGIIVDATSRVMVKLKNANDIDESFISSSFWFEFKTTALYYNRSAEKWGRLKKAARLMNVKYYTNFPAPHP